MDQNIKKYVSRNAPVFIITCLVLTMMFDSLESSFIFASVDEQQPATPVGGKYFSSINRVQNTTSESLLNQGRTAETSDEEIKNVTIVDYAEPSSPIRQEIPFSISATDPCGDGSNQFTTENGGIRWQTFPVTYAIDTSNSGTDPTIARNAVIRTFEEYDTYIPGQAFSLINDYNAAKIKFNWQPIDGPFGQVGIASYSYSTPSLALISATVTLDSDENWFDSTVHSCGSSGSSMDIESVAAHELGHAVGLGHVTDNLLTMYPTTFAGETLKRSLGIGDRLGLEHLYLHWSAWTSLGGTVRADSDPVVAVNADGRMQLFAIGTGNGVVTKWQTSPGSSTWSAWTSLGGTVRANSDPVVAVNSDGRLQLFVVGTGNGVVTKWQTAPGSSTWSAWTSLGGTVRANSDPVVAVNSDGRLQLFVVGTGNGVVTKWQTAPGSSTWSAWTSLGGTVRANSDPVVAVNSDGRLQLFVVGTGNGVVTKWQTAPGSSTWSAWTSLGGTVRANSDPVVVRNADGRLQLFVIGTGNGVVTKWQTSPGSSTWSAWTSLGGTVRANSDPVVAVNSDGRLQLFVVGTGNGVVTKWQTAPGSSTWSAWTSLGGAVRANSDPVVAVNSDGRLQLFVVGTGNGVVTKWQSPS